MPFKYMVNHDRGGATARLLANLAREKPPARDLRVATRYLPGANLDWTER